MKAGMVMADKETIFPQRKDLRLNGFDYDLTGAYFVTVCVKGKKQMLSNIRNIEIMPVGETIGFPSDELQFINFLPNQKKTKNVSTNPDTHVFLLFVIKNRYSFHSKSDESNRTTSLDTMSIPPRQCA